MSGRWFRFYADAMRNPKVAKLSDFEFRLWMELLCVASENEGRIPRAEDLKHVLNRRLDHLLRGLNSLIKHGLIDALDGNDEAITKPLRGHNEVIKASLDVRFTPHNWSKFQYKSDTSRERVAKHRAKCNVTVTPPETDTDKNISSDTNVSSDIGETLADTKPTTGKPKITTLDIDQAVKNWSMGADKAGWPKPRTINPARREKIRRRLAEIGLEGWNEALRRALRSEMLGHDPPSWFTFDWIVKNSGNILKVLEGNYDSKFKSGAEIQPFKRKPDWRDALAGIDGGDVSGADRSGHPAQFGLLRLADPA